MSATVGDEEEEVVEEEEEEVVEVARRKRWILLSRTRTYRVAKVRTRIRLPRETKWISSVIVGKLGTAIVSRFPSEF